MFSGGVGSWAAARRVAARHGTDNLTLLFADTLIEDEDLYRFITQAAADVGGELVRIADGRTPWQLFREHRFLGNTRVDLCSRVLKRELCQKWLNECCDPAWTQIHVGIDWSESHRFVALRERYRAEGWHYNAPLCDWPYLTKRDIFDQLASSGIALPRLYTLGFAHNNCGGGCVKAGQGHFAHLLQALPERYAEWEREEEALRHALGKDVAILRDRRDGDTKPLTLRALRERIGEGDQPDLFALGGCGCFSDVDESPDRDSLNG